MEVALPKEDLELVSVRRGLPISFNVALQMALQMNLLTSHTDNSGTVMIGPPDAERPLQASASSDLVPRSSHTAHLLPRPDSATKPVNARQVSDAVRTLAYTGTLQPFSIRGSVFHSSDENHHEDIIRAAVACRYMQLPWAQNPFQATLDPCLKALCWILGRSQSKMPIEAIIDEVSRKCKTLDDAQIRERLLAACSGTFSLLTMQESGGKIFLRWHHPAPATANRGKPAPSGNRKRPRSLSPRR